MLKYVLTLLGGLEVTCVFLFGVNCTSSVYSNQKSRNTWMIVSLRQTWGKHCWGGVAMLGLIVELVNKCVDFSKREVCNLIIQKNLLHI